MGDEFVRRALEEAIAKRERELTEFRQRLKDLDNNNGDRRPKRRRKATGLKPGSVPSMIADILSEAKKPLSSAEIADRLEKKGKKVESRFVASAVNRYVESGRVFNRSDDGLYSLLSDAA